MELTPFLSILGKRKFWPQQFLAGTTSLYMLKNTRYNPVSLPYDMFSQKKK